MEKRALAESLKGSVVSFKQTVNRRESTSAAEPAEMTDTAELLRSFAAEVENEMSRVSELRLSAALEACGSGDAATTQRRSRSYSARPSPSSPRWTLRGSFWRATCWRRGAPGSKSSRKEISFFKLFVGRSQLYKWFCHRWRMSENQGNFEKVIRTSVIVKIANWDFLWK